MNITIGTIASSRLKLQNLLLYSEQLDNTAAWNPNGTTITPNQATDVAGGSTLDMIAFGSDYSNIQQYIPVTPNTQYTLSFEAKRGTNTEAYANFQDATNGNTNIVSTLSFYSLINTSTPVRVSQTFTTPAGCTSLNFTILTFTSHGTLYAGRALLVKGAVQGTYVLTTSTTVG